MDVDHDTGYAVMVTARAFVRVAEARMRPLGLGVAHLPVLVALAQDGPLTQTEIARRTHIEQPTAAALLQRMDTAGLITRSPDAHDRRVTQISLSTHAAELLPQALRLRREAIAAATAGMTAAEIEVLNVLLGRVLSNLDSMMESQSGRAGD